MGDRDPFLWGAGKVNYCSLSDHHQQHTHTHCAHLRILECNWQSFENFSQQRMILLSNAEEDIRISYDLGVNSFIVKPESFEALVESMKALARYWFKTVELPD